MEDVIRFIMALVDDEDEAAIIGFINSIKYYYNLHKAMTIMQWLSTYRREPPAPLNIGDDEDGGTDSPGI